jgi:L-asparaginase II
VGPPISVVVSRGDVVESRHDVHAVAVRDGEVVDAAGAPDVLAYLRSAAKPFQALPLLRAAPEIAEDELAIACASHEATPDQLAAVRRLLARSGSTEEELECGEADGSRLKHNCSGKHAGMLAVTKRHGWPLPGYRTERHPLQREILSLVSEAAEVREEDIRRATDGCGVVTFAVALRAMATAFARLVREDLPGSDRVVAAMRARPDLVGGPSAPDTAFMAAQAGALAKRGAEGLLCAALADGTGIAVKAEDGANRAAGPALARFVGVDTLAATPVFNSRGDEIGLISAV